jgi:membrane protease YdiL (CAAX protease family)
MRISLRKIQTSFLGSTFSFIFILVVLDLVVIKIPFERLFIGACSYETSKDIARIIHGFIIITGSIFFIKKLRLEKFSGIKLFQINNPYLLLIPLIYPMSLGWSNFSEIDSNDLSRPSFILAFSAIIFKGLAEEYAFRGLLQPYLIEKLGDRFSLFRIVCISATVFALMHIVNITRYGFVDIINQVIGAFFFGVFFGALLLRTVNVFMLGFLHGFINFLFKVKSLAGNNLVQEDVYLYSAMDIFLTVLKYSLFFSPLFFIGFFLLKGWNREKLLNSINK